MTVVTSSYFSLVRVSSSPLLLPELPDSSLALYSPCVPLLHCQQSHPSKVQNDCVVALCMGFDSFHRPWVKWNLAWLNHSNFEMKEASSATTPPLSPSTPKHQIMC